MKIPRKPSLKPSVVIAAIIGVAILGAGGVFAYQHFTNQASESQKAPDKQEEIPVTPTTTPPAKGGQQNTPDEDPETPSSDGPAITITAMNQNDGTLQIRSVIQAIWSDGTCTLSMTKASDTVTREAALQPLPSTTTCQGFDIPVSDLSPGSWTVRITATNGTTTINTESETTIQ